MFKAHRLVHHSTLGWRVIKKKKKRTNRARDQDGVLGEGARGFGRGFFWFRECLTPKS